MLFRSIVNKTSLGRAQRATEQDRKMAALLGIDVDRTISVTFIMGASLAAVAGTMYLMYYGVTVFTDGFIPGVKPGKKTAEYLDSIMSRITLPGSIFLGIVAILPAFARFFGISQNFAQFFGGTSLLILVGVVLDTLQQIESHLMMHHYDGLMKDGKIKGRTTGSAY